MNRDVLARRLEKQGYEIESAGDGRRAMEMILAEPGRFDLILLDIMMPFMNGFEVLERLKGDESLRHIPVIMISAMDDIESVVRCIQLGAEDYLPKPFNPTLLRARVGATLEKKRLRDKERAYLAQIQAEQERSERLLLNILPEPIAKRLKADETGIADSFAEVSVLFADIVDFTSLTSQASPQDLIRILNEIFTEFDTLAERYQMEKIKTIGDAYMVVGGLPTPTPDHAEGAAAMAIGMQDIVRNYRGYSGRDFSIRIGIDVGPVIAGVIGRKKFIYDLWGATVNLASRMEAQGLPGMIQVTPAARECLKDRFQFEERGPIQVKGVGELVTYFLTGRC
jgi:class 3 adenylate cyclase